MEYKETYEKFWSVGKNVKFEDYERNRELLKYFSPVNGLVRVADIAGGTGVVSDWLEKRGYEVILVEFSDIAVEEAKKKGLTVIQSKIEGVGSLPFVDDYFDVVFFGDIIEHLFDAESVLKEIKRVLKPNGRLIISCPNIAYWRFRTYYFVDGSFERIDVARQKPWEQEHIRFYNINILKEFLSEINFQLVRFSGVNNIWHSKWLSGKLPNLFAHTIVSEFINKK
jgi:methionine biosynthesis protein MetW